MYFTRSIRDVAVVALLIGGPLRAASLSVGQIAGFPIDCDPVCENGPCFFLRAVAVNGQAIAPTSCVPANPGDLIETEIHISDWATALPNGAGIYQATINAEDSALSGLGGLILPVGWGSLVPDVTCSDYTDCPPGTGCTPTTGVGDRCRGPNHNPQFGFFIDTTRTDFVFAGYPFLQVVATTLLFNYVALSQIDTNFGNRADPGVPTYGGTLLLVASEAACGGFTYQFDLHPWKQVFGDFIDQNFPLVEVHPLYIMMADDDCAVICGDGQIESPEECDDGNTAGGDGCSATCQSEFEPIPTVSEWGLLALALMLLIGAKVRPAVQARNESLRQSSEIRRSPYVLSHNDQVDMHRRPLDGR